MTRQIVTANRLKDGRVVYLTAGAGWSRWIADSDHAADAAALLAVGEAAAAARIVIDPYLIEVTLDGGSPRPVLRRERIRATGPNADDIQLREVA